MISKDKRRLEISIFISDFEKLNDISEYSGITKSELISFLVSEFLTEENARKAAQLYEL